MTSIITRSALLPGGIAYQPDRVVPPDLASVIVEDGAAPRIVTWAMVMEQRRQRQQVILHQRRHVKGWRAARLMVAHYGDGLMGGWQAMLDGLGRHHHCWIDRDGQGFRRRIMELFPLLLPLGDEWQRHWESWEAFKPLFAKAFQRRRQARHPIGVAFLWRKGHELRRTPP